MDSKINFSFKKSYTLKAQSPIIHFQHNQQGATLRATEVKPKLDAFLKKKSASIPQNWFIGNSGALNYKLHFEAENHKVSTPAKLPPKIYYGNMGLPDCDKVKCILGNCKMNVVCTIKGLMELIDKYIGEFFIVHNFGRMQNKGFGSFTVEDENTRYTLEEIRAFLSQHAGASRSFYICGYDNGDTEQMFGDIARIYGIMKSGFNFGGSYHRSYLFDYFIDKDIGNEKAYMKKEKISPAVVHPNNKNRVFPEQNYSDYKYTRALLGLGEHIEYIKGFKSEKDEKGRYPITGKERVSINNSDFDRLPSPIFFKIINNVIYIVPKRINEDIFGKSFEFKNEATEKSTIRSVPDTFDIDAFMKYFVDRYNTDSEQKDKNGKTVKYSIGKKIRY